MGVMLPFLTQQQQQQVTPKKAPVSNIDSFFDISGQTIAARDFNNPYAVGRQVTQRKARPLVSQVNALQQIQRANPMTANPYRPIGSEQTYTPIGFASGGGIDSIVNSKTKGTLLDLLRLLGDK